MQTNLDRSYSGYGKVGQVSYCQASQSFSLMFLCDRFERRFRIYEISDFGETIRTYKRTEKDEIIDDMVLVGKTAPPFS